MRHPEAMVGVAEDADKLRSAVGIAADNLAAEGRRLYIVVDGLDHVWRDTRRVDQLNHLFNEAAPAAAECQSYRRNAARSRRATAWQAADDRE